MATKRPTKKIEALAEKDAGQAFRRTPHLDRKRVEDLASEAWWNVAFGIFEGEIDAEDGERLYTSTFVAAYERCSAQTKVSWKTPRVAAMWKAMESVDEEAKNRVLAFIRASGLDDSLSESCEPLCALIEYTLSLREASWITRHMLPKGAKASPTISASKKWEEQIYGEVDWPAWQTLFARDVARWGSQEERLIRWLWQLPEEADIGIDNAFTLIGRAADAEPERDIFQTAYALLLRTESAENILPYVIENSMFAVTKNKAVTSLGRFLAALPTETLLPRVLEKDREVHYGRLLVLCDTARFDAHLKRLATSNGVKLSLVNFMLHADRDRYESTILDWGNEMKSAYERAHWAIYVCHAFGARHQKKILEVTKRALREFGGEDETAFDDVREIPALKPYADFPNSSVKLSLVACVLSAFGKDAFAFVESFTDDWEGNELRFCEIVGKYLPGEPAVLKRLVAALSKELSSDMGGGLTEKEYLRRVGSVLKKYELGKYEAVVAARLGPQGAKGGKMKTSPASKKKKPGPAKRT